MPSGSEPCISPPLNVNKRIIFVLKDDGETKTPDHITRTNHLGNFEVINQNNIVWRNSMPGFKDWSSLRPDHNPFRNLTGKADE